VKSSGSAIKTPTNSTATFPEKYAQVASSTTANFQAPDLKEKEPGRFFGRASYSVDNAKLASEKTVSIEYQVGSKDGEHMYMATVRTGSGQDGRVTGKASSHHEAVEALTHATAQKTADMLYNSSANETKVKTLGALRKL
jgi:hypothetical protein